MTADNLPALLRPLAGELSPEARSLASSLRVLFDGLEISVRRYGVRRSRDAGAISRYLNGTRLPPWEFILELVRDVAAQRGESVKAETLELLRNQHRAAAEAQGGSVALLKITQDRLADADRNAQQAAIQLRVLTEAVQDRQVLLDDVELQLRQVRQASAVREMEASLLAEERNSLIRERGRLREEVESLTCELRRAWGRTEELEAECSALEQQLAGLDEVQQSDGPLQIELTSGLMAFGMLRMGGFTRLTRRLSDEELIEQVKYLRDLCERIALRTGARFTYTRSSEVSFIASSARAIAETALQVIEGARSRSDLAEIGIGLCYGKVLFSSGVSFSETVSRAESFCAIAPKGGVLVSQGFADQLHVEGAIEGAQGGSFSVTEMWQRPVRGLGVEQPWLVARADEPEL
jgi:uncharacterized membrane protein YgdD (TMEM256/DUF423 family)